MYFLGRKLMPFQMFERKTMQSALEPRKYQEIYSAHITAQNIFCKTYCVKILPHLIKNDSEADVSSKMATGWYARGSFQLISSGLILHNRNRITLLKENFRVN